jgi:hypothetical protein
LRLLRGSEPKQDESFLGFILRLCELNGYSDPSWIFEIANLSIKTGSRLNWQPHQITSNLRALSYVTKSSEKLLSDLFYSPLDDTFSNYYGHVLPRDVIHLNNPKVCPSCISEFGYIRGEWDLSIVTCCRVHARLLVNSCPSCKKSLSWVRSRMNFCKCGYDLMGVKIDSVPVEETLLSKIVNEKILAQNSSIQDLFIAMLSLDEIINIVKLFSHDFEKFEPHNRGCLTKLFSKDIISMHARIRNAFSLLRNWPSNFHEFLKSTKFAMYRKYGRHSFGLHRQFGKFYVLAVPYFQKYDFLKKAFEDYLKQNFQDGYISRLKIARLPISDSKYLGQEEAASILCVKPPQIRALLNTGLLSGHIKSSGKRHFVQIEKASIERLIANHEAYSTLNVRVNTNLLNLTHAAKYAGICADAFKNLVKSNLISEVVSTPRKLYSKKDIETMTSQIRAKISDCTSIQDDEVTSFFQTVQMVFPLNYGASDIIKAIFDNGISPIGEIPGKGISGFIFSKRHIQVFIRNQIERRKSCNISAIDYARKIGISVDAVRFFSKRGFIQAHHEGIGIGTVIPPSAISEFEGRFSILSSLARTYKLHSVNLMQYLRSINVYPVSGPAVDGGYNYLYKKTEVDSINFAFLRPKRKKSNS